MALKRLDFLALAALTAFRVQAGSLPAPWVSAGCFTDNTSSRTLKTAATSDVTNMTIEACIEFCTPTGYTFAGLEFGRECYCDNNIEATGVPATDGCNMECTGDSTEICGGPNRINIYKRTIPAGWSSVGCFTDDSSQRTLKTAATTDVAGMTIEECASFCTPLGFQFAGVEFGRGQIDCDNIIESTGAPATDGCNMPCTGDSNEICGGANRINIYNNTALTHPIPVAPVPTNRQTVGTYQFQGCFLDVVNGSANALSHRMVIPGGTTLELCTSYCKAAGFPVAGVELGHECWCDTYMPLVAKAPDSDCNLACQGPDISQSCGAVSRLAVYTDTSATPPPLSACLTNVASLSSTTTAFRFNMLAVPAPGVQAPPVTLGITDAGQDINTSELFYLTNVSVFFDFEGLVSSGIATKTFSLQNGVISPDDLLGGQRHPVAERVDPDGQFIFIADSKQPPPTFSQFCAMPNPQQPFGPFIGPPIIAINGTSDNWYHCRFLVEGIYLGPGDPTFGDCHNVLLEMIFPSVGSH